MPAVARLIAMLVLAGAAWSALGASQPDPAAPFGQAVDDAQAFELPSLPLHEALEAYSRQTRRSVLYDTSLAATRRSAPLHGRYTPEAALRGLLAGTGLVSRNTSSRSFMLVPVPAAPAEEAEAARPTARPAVDAYAARVRRRVMGALCADPALQAGDYRLLLRFRIDSRQRIDALQIAATGRPEQEPGIRAALTNLSLGSAPPAGYGQPTLLLLTPESARRHGGCPRRRRRAARPAWRRA
ncbi:Outer membrane TonB-dependent transducer VreA of trans-envelope signaling system [plant metagenome]|uniref:Outer membrane TonB-dependent transducer VreA of trans-envelope signaling system n=1 Tax=plant metagenome TaxID=1297885 RepID=A0A484R404_9ZZZZ